jgi:kinesin family protein 2/24
MDDFYRRHRALYEKLVDSVDVTAPVTHFSQKTARPGLYGVSTSVSETCNPAMIVGARIRPMLDESKEFPCAVYPREQQTGLVDLHDLYNYPYGKPILKSTKHQVDKVYSIETTSEDIFHDVVSHLVELAQIGGIGTLFAYGQTGSGKTYTISQLQQLAILSLVDAQGSSQSELYMTICDLAGNSAFDLLDSRSPVSVLQDEFGTTHLAGESSRTQSATWAAQC